MRRALGMVFDPWQTEVLESEHRQLLLNASRQSGKSTVSAYCAFREALTVPGSTTLIVSPTERQSQLMFKTVMKMYRKTGRLVPSRVENQLSLELMTGSQIVALPGDPDNIRGYSNVSLLLIDEASRVPDAVVAAVRPMLAVAGGRLIALSTPNGKQGWWYEAWIDTTSDWARWEVPATECPRISPKFLAEEKLILPRIFYEAEYFCRFVEPTDAAFACEGIRRAMTGVVPLTAQRGAALMAPYSR
ncbi:MAG: terminase family protein [Thermomicrobiales bacterium]